MAKRTIKKKVKKKPIESYDHTDKKRANNPPVGLVTPDTDPDAGSKQTYEYDPHLDPQLVWAGKAELSMPALRFRPSRSTSTSGSTRAPSSRPPASATAT